MMMIDDEFVLAVINGILPPDNNHVNVYIGLCRQCRLINIESRVSKMLRQKKD